MATTIYCYRTQPTDPVPTRHNPDDRWVKKVDGTDWGLFTQRAMRTSRSSSAVLGDNTNTVAGPTSPFDGQSSISGPYCWMSPPLAEDVTIAGSITVNWWAIENSMSANAAVGARIWHLPNDGTISVIGDGINTTELGTASAVRQVTITPTSTAFKKGDRIGLTYYLDDASGVNMASGFTAGVRCGPGGSSGVDGDSWVQFNETFTFEETAPGGSVVYFTNSAASGGLSTSSTDLEAWTSRGGGVQSAVVNTAVGGAIHVTDTAGGTVVDWFTRPLQAVTLAGVVLLNLRGFCSSASAGIPVWKIEIARVEGDGTSPTVWGSARADDLISNTASSEQLTDQYWCSGEDLAITDGQRIRLRMYIDNAHIGTEGAMAGSRTATFRYAGTSGGAAGDSWVQFDQTLAEFTGGGGATEDPMPYVGAGYYG